MKNAPIHIDLTPEWKRFGTLFMPSQNRSLYVPSQNRSSQNRSLFVPSKNHYNGVSMINPKRSSFKCSRVHKKSTANCMLKESFTLGVSWPIWAGVALLFANLAMGASGYSSHSSSSFFNTVNNHSTTVVGDSHGLSSYSYSHSEFYNSNTSFGGGGGGGPGNSGGGGFYVGLRETFGVAMAGLTFLFVLNFLRLSGLSANRHAGDVLTEKTSIFEFEVDPENISLSGAFKDRILAWPRHPDNCLCGCSSRYVNTDDASEEFHTPHDAATNDDVDLEVVHRSELNKNRPSNTDASSNNGKTKKKVSGAILLNKTHDRIANVVESFSATSTQTSSRYPSIAECLAKLESIPGVSPDDDMYVWAARLFLRDKHRECFMTLPMDEVRLRFLKLEIEMEKTCTGYRG